MNSDPFVKLKTIKGIAYIRIDNVDEMLEIPSDKLYADFPDAKSYVVTKDNKLYICLDHVNAIYSDICKTMFKKEK